MDRESAGAGTGDLQQLYLAALEDYRFQVNLTWSRTQYLLTLNSGLVSIAVTLMGLAESDERIVAIVFALGFGTALSSIAALTLGRRYYHPVLARIHAIENDLDLPYAHRLRTTPEQGGPAARLRISYVFVSLFVGIALIDIAGLALTLS